MVIDEYNCVLENKKYFIICFSNTLLVVQQSDLSKISHIFTTNPNSMIFCLSGYIQNSIKSVFPHINLEFNQNDQTIVNDLVLDFPSITINNVRANKFWKIIEKCIFAYLIQKGLTNSSINRIQFSEKLFEQEKPFTTNDFKQKFVSIKCLSTTSLSQVYLCFNVEEEKFFILKTALNENENYIHVREKKVYSKICNPFIPKYYGEIEESGQNKILIEFIKGKSLDKLNQLNLNESDKINIIFELMITIQYFHSHNYIYRDLKPENIIIDDCKTAVIIDFNKMIENESDQMTKDFAHFFCAPEVFLDKPYTNKCDIYSLGLIIRYILTGKKPSEISESNRDNSSDDLKIKLINRCIDENPENRPSITRLINEFYLILLSENYSYLNSNILKIYRKNVDYEECDQTVFENQFFMKNDMYRDIMIAPKNIEKVINNCHLAAYYNSAYSCFIFGVLFFKGIIVSKDINKAMYFYNESAKLNYADSLLNIAINYYEGEYVERNVEKSLSYVRYLMDQNNSNAQFFAGLVMLVITIIPSVHYAVEYFQQAARQNHPYALYYLGYIYFEGESYNSGIKKDVQKGIEYYELAARLNQPNALYQLGYIYYNGINVPRDYEKGIHYFTLAANLNQPNALLQLGLISLDDLNYDRGFNYLYRAEQQTIDPEISIKAKYNLGVTFFKMNKIEQAIHYLTEVANSNINSISIPLAQTNLGLIYYDSYMKDINKSIHYFQLGADNNNVISQFYIGWFYLNGIQFKKNIDKAIHYLTLSANQNNLRAQFILGCIYLLGDKATQYMEKGLHYMNLAAEQNYPSAIFGLGDIYFRGTCEKIGIKKDIQKGIEYFHKAADLYQPNALSQLGYMYFHGHEVPININKGIYYYQLAANQNEPEANCTLGKIYTEGIYVQKDDVKAINCYLLAANQSGDLNASNKAKYHLGLLFFKTKSHLHDINKSIQYLKEAAKFNIPEAQFSLGTIYYEGIEIPRDTKEAIHYFVEASNFNSLDARNNLGVIFKTGDGVEKNIARSLIYFKESIEKEEHYLAFFNYVHTKFYENKNEFDYDEAVNLLSQILEKNISYSMKLLCLIIIDKHKSVTLEIIENDIHKIQSKKIKGKLNNISISIYDAIKMYHIENPSIFIKIYNEVKGINLIHTYQFGLISFHMLDELKKMKEKSNPQHIAKNINNFFYAGFGEDIVS